MGMEHCEEAGLGVLLDGRLAPLLSSTAGGPWDPKLPPGMPIPSGAYSPRSPSNPPVHLNLGAPPKMMRQLVRKQNVSYKQAEVIPVDID